MRLIDADKLKDRQFAIGDGDTHAVEAVVSLDDIDAQPVISCETCEHYDDNPMVRRHGRGPDGARCKSCRQIIATGYRTNRTYWKCRMRGMSHGQGTDHRLKWNACRLYEEATNA